MVHLRLVAPSEEAERVLHALAAVPSVCNVVHLEGAVQRPQGDLILCDVAREDASLVFDDLRSLGLDQVGSISMEEIDTVISAAADRAEEAAAGSPADAVVWEQVEERTSESAELSFSFLGFMVLAALIAGAGIITDSQILIIGAMVVGPEFGPLAGLCVAVVERRAALAARSLVALAVGFPLAITATLLGTLAVRGAGQAPDELTAAEHPATLFISNPNIFSFIVALLAGVAGILSLTTAKSGALVGVLISVTTIPAAANVGVAAAYGNWDDCLGAFGQLSVNLGALILAGVATAGAQRVFYERRRGRHLRDLRAR